MGDGARGAGLAVVAGGREGEGGHGETERGIRTFAWAMWARGMVRVWLDEAEGEAVFVGTVGGTMGGSVGGRAFEGLERGHPGIIACSVLAEPEDKVSAVLGMCTGAVWRERGTYKFSAVPSTNNSHSSKSLSPSGGRCFLSRTSSSETS